LEGTVGLGGVVCFAFRGLWCCISQNERHLSGSWFCSVQVASWGTTLVFKHFAGDIFEKIAEESQSVFSGRLDAKVVNSRDFVTDELIPEVLAYRLV
jgi:hypothetical protein